MQGPGPRHAARVWCRVQGLVLGVGLFMVEGAVCRIWCSVFMNEGAGWRDGCRVFMVEGVGCRVQGLVLGAGLKVWGVGCRGWCWVKDCLLPREQVGARTASRSAPTTISVTFSSSARFLSRTSPPEPPEPGWV